MSWKSSNRLLKRQKVTVTWPEKRICITVIVNGWKAMEGLLHDHDFTPRCQAVLIQQSEMFMHVAGIWQWSYKPPWHRILLIAAMNNILPMIALCLCFVHHKQFWYPSKYQMLSEWQAAAVLQHHCDCNYILTASFRINDKIRILQQWNCYRFFLNLLEVLIAKSSSLPQ